MPDIKFPSKEELEGKYTAYNPTEDETEKQKLEKIQVDIEKARVQTELITQKTKQLKDTPLSADQLEDTADFRIEDPDVKEPDLSNVNAYYQKLEAERLATSAAYQKRIEEVEEKGEEDKKNWWEDIKEKFGATTAEKTQEKWEELGISPETYFAQQAADVAQVGGLMDSYNAKLAQRDSALEADQALPGRGIAYATREQKRISDRYNIELNQMSANINTQLSIRAMNRGDFAEAKSFVKDAVANYVYDSKLAYEQYDTFYEANQDLIDDLEKDYKDALDEAQDASLEAYKEKKDEADWKADLIIDYPDAGISLSDTKEEVLEKVKLAAPEEDLLSPTEAKTLGVPYGTTKSAAAKMGIIPAAGIEAPVSKTGANYNTRLNQEITAMYAGRYGKIGARESVINVLRDEFPQVDVSADIYRRVPDDYEKNIKVLTSLQFEWDLTE